MVRNFGPAWLHPAIPGALALLLVLLGPTSAGAEALPWLAQADDGSDSGQSSAPSTAPGALDPCQIVPSAEASALAGVAYTAGTLQVNGPTSWTCVYGSQTPNVFMVTVAQAPDAATAQAQWSEYEAQAQDLMAQGLPAGVAGILTTDDVSDVPGADRAAIAQGSASIGGQTINASAIYLIKGATFLTYSDLLVGQPAPTTSALEAEAQTAMGRLP